MNGDYQSSQQYYSHYQQQRYPTQHQVPEPQPVDTLQNAHSLLAAYPFASATPTSHVTRHLSNLSLSAAPPSFYIQPASYSANTQSYPQQYPLQYNQYTNEINHLNSSRPHTRYDPVWDSARSNAVRYLGEQNQYTQYEPQSWHVQQASSSYQPTPFAQSLFQHTAPTAFYPTPPPPGIHASSSSLASALGEPKPKPIPQKVFTPQQSPAFFNQYLAEQTQKIPSHVPSAPSTPHRNAFKPPTSSPDPLAMTPNSRSTVLTPRKRKADVPMESPSLKRVHEVTPRPSFALKPSSLDSSEPLLNHVHRKNATPNGKKVFVEVPPMSSVMRTPSSHSRPPPQTTSLKKKKVKPDGSDDDLGGFGSEESVSPPNSIALSGSRSPVKKATGDRDERAPLDKLTTLLEDIFEADDSLPPDATMEDLSTNFFSTTTVDYSRPQLHPSIVRKLTGYISKISRPTKRLRMSSREHTVPGATPRHKGRMADIETAMLSRILRILERSVKVGEELNPFPKSSSSSNDVVPPTPSKKGKGKKKTERDRSKSKTPKPDGIQDDDPMPIDEHAPSSAGGISEADLDTLESVLNVARDSVLAADCCIALLSSDRLTKQLYSEELIMSCLVSVKNQLDNIVYPFVETFQDLYGRTPLMVTHLIRNNSTGCNLRRKQIAEIFQIISTVLPRINELVCSDYTSMSEFIIIQAVFIAIGPFFMAEPPDTREKEKKATIEIIMSTFGSSALRGLRLDALSLIRSIFANHESQRSWIIEEILSSLMKLFDSKQKAGQFRLRDGRTISTISALLMQIVQTSTHTVKISAQAQVKARMQAAALRRRDSTQQVTNDDFLDDVDKEEIRIYMSGLDSAVTAAKTIIFFLTQRSGKTKTTKNVNEAEYRAIFDSLVSDALTVLFWPEWPASCLILEIACNYMIGSLKDAGNSAQNDNNAAKTMALDHLGVIAARLRTTHLKFQGNPNRLRSMEQVSNSHDIKFFNRLSVAHEDVLSHLSKKSAEDQACASARELAAVNWGHELAKSVKSCSEALENSERIEDQTRSNELLEFGHAMKDTLRGIWKDSSPDVFDSDSHEENQRIDIVAEEVGLLQSRINFNRILNDVLLALRAPAVFMRTKALKALGQIVTSDPSILSSDNVSRAINSHLQDNSPAVRDAAVELIGKYMIDSPEFAGNYYQQISQRIADTGLGVRKRVIKLMKSFYAVTQDANTRTDICHRLVVRYGDEEESVKDLAVKTIEELWFHDTSPVGNQRTKSISNGPSQELMDRITVIVGVVFRLKERPSLVEDVLRSIMTVDEKTSGFSALDGIRTVYLFTAAYPPALVHSNPSILLPYLKPPSSGKESSQIENQQLADYLLRIFRLSIPHLPKTAVKFGQSLQVILQEMVVKPSTSGGMTALQEAVACWCAVAEHLTHEYEKLARLFRSCNIRLKQALDKKQVNEQLDPRDRTALIMLTAIVSLLCEHCSFDGLRERSESLRADIDAVTTEPVNAYVYNILLRAYDKYSDVSVRSRVLHCLGILFRAEPSLMLKEESSHIMDAIFDSPEVEARVRLLKVLQGFLTSEAEKHTAVEKDLAQGKQRTAGHVDMEELVGNTDGFAESGVSSAVVQRYLPRILEAVLLPNLQIQLVALDIVGFAVKQGLAHPIQLFPVLVSIETETNPTLSNRAYNFHNALHTKHGSLLNARFIECARTTYEYQKRASIKVEGYRRSGNTPLALLQPWYSLVRDKRSTRQEFLKSLLRVFDVDIYKSTQENVDFLRYMAENFAAFEYKTIEEVLTVIKSLTSVLSTTGSQMVELLSPSHLLKELHSSTPNGDQMMVDAESMASAPNPASDEELAQMRSSVIVGIVMILKTYLKTLYNLSEEKCAKFVVGKKSAVGDKPANRKNDTPISWDRIPFASSPILTRQHIEAQKNTFLLIWSEDGQAAEPEDEDM
ncbi:Sister chromatid cohesion protein [Abortiporus biennis]